MMMTLRVIMRMKVVMKVSLICNVERKLMIKVMTTLVT